MSKKRFFDLLLGITIFALLVIPMLLISIAVRLSSKGPTKVSPNRWTENR